MQPLYLPLRNGTFFKVVASKPVTVQLGWPSHGFYYSVNGTYVGKEFVFVATTDSCTVFAIEQSQVIVENSRGGRASFKLDANGYKIVDLTPSEVYRVRSTGHVMVMIGFVPGPPGGWETVSFMIPSAQGGFVGTYFLTNVIGSPAWGKWDKIRDYGFRVLAVAETRVALYDLETGAKMGEYVVPAGAGIVLKPQAQAVALVSEKPVTFAFLHNGSIEVEEAQLDASIGGRYCGYPCSTMFFLLRPNEDTMIQVPSNASVEVYFFAKEEAEVVVDDAVRLRVGADAPLPLHLFVAPGVHKVKSSREVLVQINSWPRYPPTQGLLLVGYVIPPLESANIKPSVTITLPGPKVPLSHYAAAAGAVVAAVAALVLVWRKRATVSRRR
jgi:hypothetical protein